MTHEEKIAWMQDWAERNNLTLQLESECGFGRECVGVLDPISESFPDYKWYDEKTRDDLDDNGDVWTPEDAYHKHPCVAVLGCGENAEAQLYDWLKWFEDNNFKHETGDVKRDTPFDRIELMLCKHKYTRMVRQ